MRRFIHQVSLAVAVYLFLGAAVVSAQSSTRLVGDIPFEFHVGQATLPSGEYTVKSGYPTADTICIQSKDRSRSAMVQTIPFSPGKEGGVAKLVFTQYGSNYFLSQVWNPSESIVRELNKSKLEMEVARKVRESQATEVALRKH